MAGDVLGMQTRVVKPPRAAAAVPVAIVPAFVLALWMTRRYEALDWATFEKSGA